MNGTIAFITSFISTFLLLSGLFFVVNQNNAQEAIPNKVGIKIPKQFVKPAVVQLSDLKVGEECYIDAASLWVHKDYTLWLDPSYPFRKQSYGIVTRPEIKIKRTKRGYEVELLKVFKDFKFQMNDISSYWRDRFIPVIKFSVEGEPKPEKRFFVPK